MTRFYHKLINLLGLREQSEEVVRRLSFRYYEWLISGGQAPLLLYQVGKVGSQTVAQTIATSLDDQPVLHFHWLSPEALAFTRMTSEYLGRAYPGRDYWESLFVKERILASPDISHYRVITLTRDPIARNLSAFFHSWRYWYPELLERYGDNPGRAVFVEGVTSRFVETYNHQKALAWLDTELKPYFDFDIYQSGFDPQKGFQTYNTDSLNLLVIRLEDLNGRLSLALEEFLGRTFPDLMIMNQNLGEDREYSQAYRDYSDAINLPRDFVEEIYSSKYARFFYSARELDQFKDRWTKN